MAAARAWLRRHLRAVVVGSVLLVLVLALAVAASWRFASLVVVPDHSPYSEKVGIRTLSKGVGVSGQGRIVLAPSEATKRPGYYGLVWQGGHAIVGSIVSQGDAGVVRQLRDVNGYLAPGTDAGLDTSVYTGNPRQARGLPFHEVDVPDKLGPMPAWLIPSLPEPKTRQGSDGHADRGSRGVWAIVIHGINDDRQVGLRIAPTLRRAGISSLLISYRDDLGAPSSPDKNHHQGQTEWQDVQAAARYALRHGGKQLVLVGYSMGGALTTQFMERSSLANRVAGLVLDAPALDWKAILEFNAEEMGLPGFLALPVEWAIDARIDPDWNSLDALQHPGDFHLPILLFHGEEDRVVPISTSEKFAEELGHWVTFYKVPRAGHTQSWNVDPTLYDRRLSQFLLQIGSKSTTTGGVGAAASGHQQKRARPLVSGSIDR